MTHRTDNTLTTSITICLTPAQKRRIEQRAKLLNTSVSEYARRIIERTL